MVFKRKSETHFPCGDQREGNTSADGRCKKCRNAAVRVASRAKPSKSKLADKCGKGHPFTPENTSYYTVTMAASGRTVKRKICLKCQAARIKKRQPPTILKKALDPKDLNQFKCGHKRTPENSFTNAGKQYCRICRNEYYRQYTFRRRYGLPGLSEDRRKLLTVGMTPEQKIAFYTQPPDADGCKLWKGPTSRGKPMLESKTGGQKTVLLSMKTIYEKHHGKPLANGFMVQQTCGKPLCTTGSHTTAKTIHDVLHSKAAKEKTRKLMRRRLAVDRDKYVLAVNKHMPSVRRMLGKFKGRFGYLDTDDVIQDVLFMAYRMWDEERTIKNVEAWAKSVAHRRAVDIVRFMKMRKMVSLDTPVDTHSSEGDYMPNLVDMVPAPEDYDPALWFEENEAAYLKRKRFLADSLEHVSEKSRKALLLQNEGYSQKDIATMLDITENTVERHLVKARKIVLRLKRRTRASEIVVDTK